MNDFRLTVFLSLAGQAMTGYMQNETLIKEMYDGLKFPS